MTEEDFSKLKSTRADKTKLARANALKAIKTLQNQAIESKAEEITLDEINAEIEAHRKGI